MSGCGHCHRPTYAGENAVVSVAGHTVLVHRGCAGPILLDAERWEARQRALRNGATPEDYS